jgi:hypothetical protein
MFRFNRIMLQHIVTADFVSADGHRARRCSSRNRPGPAPSRDDELSRIAGNAFQPAARTSGSLDERPAKKQSSAA